MENLLLFTLGNNPRASIFRNMEYLVKQAIFLNYCYQPLMRAPAADMPLRYGPSRNDSSCKQSSACSPYLFLLHCNNSRMY